MQWAGLLEDSSLLALESHRSLGRARRSKQVYIATRRATRRASLPYVPRRLAQNSLGPVCPVPLALRPHVPDQPLLEVVMPAEVYVVMPAEVYTSANEKTRTGRTAVNQPCGARGRI